MIDGKPDWFRLAGIALADVGLFDDAGKLRFINAICEMYENAMNPAYKPESGGGFVGRAIDRQYEEFRAGIESYMKLVNANTSGKRKETQCLPNGYPMGTQTEQEEEQKEKKIVETTRTELLRSGFSEKEINSAISTIKHWSNIKNPAGYVTQIIKSQRREYRIPRDEHDYSGEQDKAMERMMSPDSWGNAPDER